MRRLLVLAVVVASVTVATPATLTGERDAPPSAVAAGIARALERPLKPERVLPAKPPARPVAAKPVRRVAPPALDPARTAGKVIEISIAQQVLTAWQDGVVVMRFKISTGRPGYRTPKGVFSVRAKGLRWWSRKWSVWMPYAMNFYSNYNLHGLPYASDPTRLIGASQLGRPASHGCVRIGPDDARALYQWTPLRTPVWIH